jgi:hypothetical protein
MQNSAYLQVLLDLSEGKIVRLDLMAPLVITTADTCLAARWPAHGARRG